MSIKIKTSGFSEKEIAEGLEKDAKNKLRRAGLSHVKVKITKKGTFELDAKTDDDMAKAAKVLGIKR